MTKKLIPTIQGDDFQSRWFWMQVCRLFDRSSKVKCVEYEANDVKSFDDVIVHYDGLLDPLGTPCERECFQTKFHVTGAGAYTWEKLMEPSFINAETISFLQRLHNARLKHAPTGIGTRFIILSPWQIHPDDSLAEIYSLADGRLDWDRLSNGGSKSKMGAIRAAWRNHLQIDSDDELRKTITPLRISQSRTLDELGAELNRSLMLAGLKSVPAGSIGHPYDDLSRKLLQSTGNVSLTRSSAEEICKRENLWVGTPLCSSGYDKRLGIRTFVRWTERLEDRCDAVLDLTPFFLGRTPNDNSSWKEIGEKLEAFLAQQSGPGVSIELELHAHLSICFLAGFSLPSKSRVKTSVLQPPNQRWESHPSEISASDIWQFKVLGDLRDKEPLAVAISITHDASGEVQSFLKDQGIQYAVLSAVPSGGAGRTAISDGRHAWALAEGLSQHLKSLSVEYGIPKMHVFAAVPAGFMFFWGQLAHPLGEICLYEFEFGSKDPTYKLSIEVTYAAC